MSVRGWVAAGVIVAAMLSALANFVPWQIAALLGLSAGVLTLVGALWLQRQTNEPDLAALANAIREQWKLELQARGVSLSAPLVIRWEASARTVSAPVPNIVAGAVGGRPIRLKAKGDLRDLAKKFDSLPRKQLVILGQPGAGKSVASIFVLLDTIGADATVPVLLPLSSWDPRKSLFDWVSTLLNRDYPNITTRDGWRDLLTSGRVLPILDGLDEIPVDNRAQALRQINRATDGGAPFVLTCRAEEYENLVHSSGTTLTSALVVELNSATKEQVINYLRRSGQEDRWAPVFAEIRAGGPLAEVLSVPLMAALMRFAFASPDTNPAELCSLTEPHLIRSRLLSSLISAAYSRTPHPDLGDTQAPLHSATEARSYLSFLARGMNRMDVTEFAWWRLHEMITGWRSFALRFCLPGPPLGAIAAMTMGPLLGAWYHEGGAVPFVLFGTLIGAAIPLRPKSPSLIDPDVDKGLQRIKGIVNLASIAVVATFAGLYVWNIWSTFEPSPGPISGPIDVIMAIGETILSIVIIPLASFAIGWVFYAVRLRRRAVVSALPTVAEAIDSDRRSAQNDFAGHFAIATLGFIAFQFWSVQIMNGPQLLAIFPFFLLVTSLQLRYASGLFWLGVLLLRRMLPNKLIDFLEDAHRRGILRQVGMVYEFRHAAVQQNLAEHSFGAQRVPSRHSSSS